MINHDHVKKRIREHIRVQRKHAPFFDWFKREKGIKEIGITRILLESIERYDNVPFHNLHISSKDPPDILAESDAGKQVGIEVCELVDEEVVRKWEQGEEVFKFWKVQELIKTVQKIIKRKDTKKFYGGPYEKIYLLIHTDEPLLEYEKFGELLSDHSFEKPKQINDGFLLFSYSPKSGYCPFVQIKFC